MSKNNKDEKILEDLIKAINAVYLDRKKLIYRSFISGIFYALGATLGLSVFILIVSYILHLMGGVPLIGNYIEFINGFIQKGQNK